ncbi:hypothetical protein ACFLZ1_03160 [Patescibacteria group bacterium]
MSQETVTVKNRPINSDDLLSIMDEVRRGRVEIPDELLGSEEVINSGDNNRALVIRFREGLDKDDFQRAVEVSLSVRRPPDSAEILMSVEVRALSDGRIDIVVFEKGLAEQDGDIFQGVTYTLKNRGEPNLDNVGYPVDGQDIDMLRAEYVSLGFCPISQIADSGSINVMSAFEKMFSLAAKQLSQKAPDDVFPTPYLY